MATTQPFRPHSRFEAGADHFDGLEDSLRVIDAQFEEAGPYKTVIGFSQGACMCCCLALLQQGRALRAAGGNVPLLSPRTNALLDLVPHVR